MAKSCWFSILVVKGENYQGSSILYVNEHPFREWKLGCSNKNAMCHHSKTFHLNEHLYPHNLLE